MDTTAGVDGSLRFVLSHLKVTFKNHPVYVGGFIFFYFLKVNAKCSEIFQTRGNTRDTQITAMLILSPFCCIVSDVFF